MLLLRHPLLGLLLLGLPHLGMPRGIRVRALEDFLKEDAVDQVAAEVKGHIEEDEVDFLDFVHKKEIVVDLNFLAVVEEVRLAAEVDLCVAQPVV